MAGLKTVEGELLRPYRFGRPSKLTKELLDKGWEYAENSDDMSASTLLPTRERLCLTLGIHKETMNIWERENKDFSDLCRYLDMIQADKAMQNGLMGRYQPAITAIVLSRHGYIRQEQTDVTSGGEKIGDISASQTEQLLRARALRDSSDI
jgi:hypothetical protein